ncbi:MAG: GTP-binding protein [Clostridia bacterium]|nr:GTP-binding protein [Clostridia bacterium]
MVKVDVISGFLGAGKTTLIKKLFESRIAKEQTVIIENEFGKVGIDSSFLKGSGVQIREINSGCICCSLVGNFEDSMKEVVEKFNPDRVIIEPSGVGKLSDVIRAIERVGEPLELNIVCTVVDGTRCRMYVKNYGEFYIDQIKEAFTVLVSKTDKMTQSKIDEAVAQIRAYNEDCTIMTTPTSALTGDKVLDALEEGKDDLKAFIEKLQAEHEEAAHHHHHHDDDEDEDEHDHHCCHHHHHDDDDDDEDHDHCCHHHHDDEEEDEDHDHHCHHHHHDEDDDEHDHCCHHHDDDDEDEDHDQHCHHHHHDEDDDEHDHCCHHHHHGHDADEVFESWGANTNYAYSESELKEILEKLSTEEFGVILRAKGVVKASDKEEWYHFDLVYGDYEIRTGEADVVGKICVIGSKFDKDAIIALFNK